MPYVRVKQKYQVTIPTSVRKAMNIHEGDTLEAKVEEGRIVLVPQVVSDRGYTQHEAKPSLLSMIGANKDSGLFDSAGDIDQMILEQRNEWK